VNKQRSATRLIAAWKHLLRQQDIAVILAVFTLWSKNISSVIPIVDTATDTIYNRPAECKSYAKNYFNRTLIVKVIVENVVTCFFMGHIVYHVISYNRLR